LIDFLTDRTAYRAHLEKTQGTDATERWENIEELKSYATLVEQENPADIDLKTEMELEEVEIGAAGTKKDENGSEEEEDGGFGDGREEIKVP